jgi:SAM-dependent methyltransferase
MEKCYIYRLIKMNAFLKFKLFVISLYILSTFTLANEQDCSELYKVLNKTAQLDFKAYPMSSEELSPKRPIDRPLNGPEGYKYLLDDTLEDKVPENGIIIDVGGAHGEAVRELSQKKNAIAIVFNTQTADEDLTNAVIGSNGKFQYVKGWAEEELPKYVNLADLLLDVYGAYSYSIEKVKLIEAYYNALKPGGMARIVVPVNSVAHVVDPAKRKIWLDRLKSRTHDSVAPGLLPLHHWLVEKYPEIFSWVSTSKAEFSWTTKGLHDGSGVLVIKKPLKDQSLKLGLTYLQHFNTNTILYPTLAPDIFLIPSDFPNPELIKNPMR